MNDPIRELEQAIQGRVLRTEQLRQYTTYRTGGEAEVLIQPSREKDLVTVVRLARERGIPLVVLGAGSNVIAPDDGLDGIVVVVRGCLDSMRFLSDMKARAGAGAMLDDLIDAAGARGYAGLEELAGIPGTVGGALYMNAGTRNAEISDCLSRLSVLTESGRKLVLDRSELHFEYRKSSLQDSGWLILSAEFQLSTGRTEALRSRAEEIRKSRQKRYPWDLPNAGSVFKHPPGGNAGRLIEEAGCKGLRVGDAAVSAVHANFIVNLGKARSADIVELIDLVESRVFEKTGIHLELEQIIL
jgi:UDP-N-acetylmuramate dehydrogenase